jgi:hypothetical protein
MPVCPHICPYVAISNVQNTGWSTLNFGGQILVWFGFGLVRQV